MDENKDKMEDVGLFGDALSRLSNTENVGYLGDPITIQLILRQAITSAVKFMEKTDDEGDRSDRLKRVCRSAGRILLGLNPRYASIPGWNKPGGIDKFCAVWCGSSETDPEVVMEHSVLKMLQEIFELADFAERATDEEWQWQFDAILQRYVGIFMGVSPALQAMAR